MKTEVFSNSPAYTASSLNGLPNGFYRFSLSVPLNGMKALSLLLLTSILILNIPMQSQTLYWKKVTSTGRYDMTYDGVKNVYFIQPDISFSHIWRSTDKGENWERFKVAAGLRALVSDNDNGLWGAVMKSGEIFTSTNGGYIWRPVSYPGGEITALTADKNGWVWVCSRSGKIYYTADKGYNWNSSVIGTAVYSLAFDNDGRIFAADIGGNIYSSANYGADWSIVYSGTYRIFKIVVDDSNHIYASKNKSVIVSKDNGISWQEFPGPVLGSTFAMNDQHIFYCNGYRSLDNCRTWIYAGPVEEVNQYCFADSLVFTSGKSGINRYDPGYKPYMGSNFFPSAVGNKWQYKILEYQSIVKVDSIHVDKDSVIGGKRYFHIKGNINEWLRYENDENVLYLRFNDSDYVLMDFNLNAGSYFSRIHFNSHHINPAQITPPEYLGSSYFSKGSLWTLLTPYNRIQHKLLYSEGLGLVKDSEENFLPNLFNGSWHKILIRASLHDSSGLYFYSDGEKAFINFRNEPTTNSFNIFWSFSVTHNYSNFLDTVLMVSYYSNSTSTVLNDTIYASNQFGTNYYNIDFRLDSVLMTSGYAFYYKLEAFDKGIVRERATSPDTGYYKLIYDSNLTSAGDNEFNLREYALMQNYPNPFNPVTRIAYSMAEASNVKLTIYDILGNEVSTILNESKPAGRYEIIWDASSYPSGVYFIKMETGQFSKTRKIMLLK